MTFWADHGAALTGRACRYGMDQCLSLGQTVRHQEATSAVLPEPVAISSLFQGLARKAPPLINGLPHKETFSSMLS